MQQWRTDNEQKTKNSHGGGARSVWPGHDFSLRQHHHSICSSTQQGDIDPTSHSGAKGTDHSERTREMAVTGWRSTIPECPHATIRLGRVLRRALLYSGNAEGQTMKAADGFIHRAPRWRAPLSHVLRATSSVLLR